MNRSRFSVLKLDFYVISCHIQCFIHIPRQIIACSCYQRDILSKQFKWVGFDRRRWRDPLSQEIVEKVDCYWMNNTSISPNKKDVCIQQINWGKYKKSPQTFLGDERVNWLFYISLVLYIDLLTIDFYLIVYLLR